MINLGDFAAGSSVYIPLNTVNADGASVTVTDLVAGDIKIHKNNSVTQRTSSAGITVSIDFDSITGNHLISIDLSDDTDSGFYAAGNDYEVRLEGITVSSQTINAWVGVFSIENRFDEVDVVKWDGTAVATPDTAGYPKTTLKDGTGQGEILTTSGKIDEVSTLTSHTAQSGDTFGALPTNFSDLSIVVSSGLVNITQTAADKVWSTTVRALSTAGIKAIWDQLTSALTTAGSIGKKLTDWVLGTDDKVILSSDAHTGATIPSVDDVNNGVDVVQISSSSDAADKLEASAETMIIGTVEEGGGPTTTVFQTNLAETTNDHFNGRTVIFTSGVLLRQSTDITDYTGASGTITVTAMTEAPSAGDTFIII